MVNLDSPFAGTIIQTFDDLKIKGKNFCSGSSEFNRGKDLPYEFEDLPSSVRAICSEFTGDMMSWFSVTRSLSSNDLSSACKKRLIVLKQNPIEGSSYKNRLLQHIFDEVITKSSDKVKQKIISLSRNHQPVRARVHSILTRLYIRVCSVAYAILRTKIIHACLFISIAILFSRACALVKAFYAKLLFDLFLKHPEPHIILRIYKILWPFSMNLNFLSVCFLTLLALTPLLEKITNALKSIHNSTEKALRTKELQDARTLWMQLV